MLKARLAVVLFGILLPYLARLPGGREWLAQYTDTGLGGATFLGLFNAIAWSAILLISLFYRRPLSVLAPAVPGFLFLAWAHYQLDLAADAQAALGIVFFPIYALLPILLGGMVGYLLERRARQTQQPG